MPKFFGLRLWSGCSSLFFTLNPHDITSSLTISLLQNDMHFEKRFSLDWNDDDTEAYIASVLKENHEHFMKPLLLTLLLQLAASIGL